MRGIRLPAATGLVAALLVGLLISACGGATSGSHLNCHGSGTMKMSDGQVMCNSAMGGGTSSGKGSGNGSMSGGSMKMGGSTSVQVDTKTPTVNGQKPLAMKILATSDWDGMKVQAQETTPVRFLVFNGTKERMIRPSKGASFHLMVQLTDEHTGEPIPYSNVWATITSSTGKVIYDNRQWPMISAFMGPHYGNDVPHLNPGRYKLTLVISPPVSARAPEYKDAWLHQHKLVQHFSWHQGASSKSMTMDGMSMSGMGSGGATTVNGYKAPRSTLVGTSKWQGMKIQTRTAAPANLTLFNGSSEQAVPRPAAANSELMVSLSDAYTSEPLPYATVSERIQNSAGKVVYKGRALPTISAFTGPVYANDVKFPAAGRYKLTLTIGPPVSARHLEYQHVWLHPHQVVQYIHWNGGK